MFRRSQEKSFFAAADVGFMDVGEERSQGIEITLAEGVELMVVTLSAARGLPEPRGSDRPDAVVQHALLVVLRLRTAFFGGQEEAVEG